MIRQCSLYAVKLRSFSILESYDKHEKSNQDLFGFFFWFLIHRFLFLPCSGPDNSPLHFVRKTSAFGQLSRPLFNNHTYIGIRIKYARAHTHTHTHSNNTRCARASSSGLKSKSHRRVPHTSKCMYMCVCVNSLHFIHNNVLLLLLWRKPLLS